MEVKKENVVNCLDLDSKTVELSITSHTQYEKRTSYC